jgi:hypothetical protein
MKTTSCVFRTSRFLVALAASLATIGAARAADHIRYDEIPQHLAPFGNVLAYRAFNIMTLDGKRHGGRRLLLESDHLRIFRVDNSFEDIPSEQVSQIAISQAGRFIHHLVESAQRPILGAELLCGSITIEAESTAGCMVPATALFTPWWVPTAVSAPFVLAADGVAFMIPPKVYEIVH